MAKQKKRKTLAQKKADNPNKSVKQKRREKEAARKTAAQKMNAEFEKGVDKLQKCRVAAHKGASIVPALLKPSIFRLSNQSRTSSPSLVENLFFELHLDKSLKFCKITGNSFYKGGEDPKRLLSDYSLKIPLSRPMNDQESFCIKRNFLLIFRLPVLDKRAIP